LLIYLHLCSCVLTHVIQQRHNAMEHGGKMSRAQRNAALKVSFLVLTFLVLLYPFVVSLSVFLTVLNGRLNVSKR
jgi:hypothetical protein